MGALGSNNVNSTYEVEINATLSLALSRIGPSELLTMNRMELASVQTVLGHGHVFGMWSTPRRWCPSGANAKLDVDMRQRLLDQMPDQSVREKVNTIYGQRVIDLAVETLTRYLIVLRMGPATISRKRAAHPLDPTYIADIGYSISSKLISVALMRWLQIYDEVKVESGRFLRIVHHDDLASLSRSMKELVHVEIKRMQRLFDRGWWTDLPGLSNAFSKTTQVAGEALTSQKERKRNPHLPLPDAYVAEMGSKSLWLTESLAPNLLQLAERINEIWLDTDIDEAQPSTIKHLRRQAVKKLLISWEWKDANGKPIEQPPFQILLSRSGKKSTSLNGESDECLTSLSWPPRTLIAVLGLLGNVQLAHFFVVSLSTGGRRSETLDLRRDCVEYKRDGKPYANGRTFKLVRSFEGEKREWVLPELAVVALEQQSRLVQIVERIGRQLPSIEGGIHREAASSDHLWLQVSGGGASDRSRAMTNPNHAMKVYAKSLAMDIRPGGQMIRPHRFRKTVARLVALALDQAPKILMDVFGHKAIEMTLEYILTDKHLQVDIEQVSRELRVMRAEEVVSSIVEAEEASVKNLSLGGYGGPAALSVSSAIQLQKERIHRSGRNWEANDARELAEILTLQGKAWEVVRHGVICTKLPFTEAGPCNKSRGRPEPSKCLTDCNHRLEEAFLREDVDSSIASSVASFEEESNAQNELMMSFWAGQIRAHVIRFSDLLEKWAKHPTVKQILNGQIAYE